jgi:hypothetical protein
LIGTLVGVTKPPVGTGLHIGVGVVFGVFELVGTAVGVSVGGGPGQIARLISEKGKPVLDVLLLLPPPQLKSNADARKNRTGPSTRDLRSQTIEP